MEDEDKDLTIEFSPQAQAAADANPDVAAYLREFCANMRQAMAAVAAGQYKSMEDAMEAITGSRPVPIEDIMTDDEAL